MTIPSIRATDHSEGVASVSGDYQRHPATRAFAVFAWSLIATMTAVTWQVGCLILYALLVLVEPLLRMLLVSLAYLSFLVTLIFGFLIGEPNFPKWGMLGFSVGTLCAYWLLLALMAVVGGVRRGRN